MASLDPYLYFDGTCEEAMRFYAQVLGGEIAVMSRYADGPASTRVRHPDRIMHASIDLGDATLMASDLPDPDPAFVAGDNVHLTLTPDTVDDAQRVFAGLADGGTVELPFEQQFWGAWMGNVTDRHGIHWMVSHPGEAT